ncbi:MAG TPA: porin [Gemmatimonadales bacterium]
MKRVALLCMGLALGAASAAEAQLTMQMSNGWNFTFSGNVNAFLTYESFDEDGTTVTPGGLIPAGGESETRIRTGLLPAFAVFDAKGKEGETDVGVHFGFAPQINCGTGVHDCFGAQIDMRQVYLTVGGTWGQILAGRELGLFGRQNILTDQTLFGIGGTGSGGVPGEGGGGTTLGRIGFGYIYPQFKAQMTYSTPAGRPFQLSIGLFEAAVNGPYAKTQLPRVEAEGVWSSGQTKVWVGGLAQSTENPANEESASAFGASGGVRFGSETFSLTGSGYYGKGLGTTLLFNLGSCPAPTCGTAGNDDLRNSYGFIGQVTFTPANSKVTVAGSYGSSYLEASDTEGGDGKTENTLISGGIYYQATKSLKVVGEFNYDWTADDTDSEKNTSFAPAFGLMLFF